MRKENINPEGKNDEKTPIDPTKMENTDFQNKIENVDFQNKIIMTDHIKNLLEKENRTVEEEKEIEEALFGKPQNRTILSSFKHYSFVSLSKTRDYVNPYAGTWHKEWVGETKTNNTVIVRYSHLGLDIGEGYSELRARLNLINVGKIKVYDPTVSMENINKKLEMGWVLPAFYIDE